MRTGTAIAAHTITTAAQVGAGAVLYHTSQPWWIQIVTQAAGLGLQTLFAWLNSITTPSGKTIPPSQN